MNANRLFMRDLVGMTIVIVAITTLALWLIPHRCDAVITEVPSAYLR